MEKELSDGLDYMTLGVLGQLGIHRQSESFLRSGLGRREISLSISERLEAGLQVEGYRVVNLCSHTFCGKM